MENSNRILDLDLIAVQDRPSEFQVREIAGTLLFRRTRKGLKVLLVHQIGDKKRRWSIPKGRVDQGESPEQTARRETREETGVDAGILRAVGCVLAQNKKKLLHCFVGQAPSHARLTKQTKQSWEIDRVKFVKVDVALKLVPQEQRWFLELALSSVTLIESPRAIDSTKQEQICPLRLVQE